MVGESMEFAAFNYRCTILATRFCNGACTVHV
jgi:hypothetical protein